MICTPVTHNPTGASLDAERRRELANVVRRKKIVLIEDDINGHLGATEAETLFSLAPEQTIYVTSMSKCLSAGLRVGFMTASADMMAGLRDSLYSTNWTAPSLHAAIASRLIVTGMAEQCVRISDRKLLLAWRWCHSSGQARGERWAKLSCVDRTRSIDPA